MSHEEESSALQWYDEERMAAWMAEYKYHLKRQMDATPDQFMLHDPEVVASRMEKAFIRNSFSKESKSIKLTCKYFGIKHTYKDIQAFLRGDVNI